MGHAASHPRTGLSGIVIQVLREPGRADVDGRAPSTRAKPSCWAARWVWTRWPRVSARRSSASAFTPSRVVAAAQLLLTWCGLRLGRDHGARWLGDKGFYVPGAILILIGLLQL